MASVKMKTIYAEFRCTAFAGRDGKKHGLTQPDHSWPLNYPGGC